MSVSLVTYEVERFLRSRYSGHATGCYHAVAVLPQAAITRKRNHQRIGIKQNHSKSTERLNNVNIYCYMFDITMTTANHSVTSWCWFMQLSRVTPRKTVYLEQQTVAQVVMKFPPFHVACRFINLSTTSTYEIIRISKNIAIILFCKLKSQPRDQNNWISCAGYSFSPKMKTPIVKPGGSEPQTPLPASNTTVPPTSHPHQPLSLRYT